MLDRAALRQSPLMGHVLLTTHQLAGINAQRSEIVSRPIKELWRAAFLNDKVGVIDARQQSKPRPLEFEGARPGREIYWLAADLCRALAVQFAVSRVKEQLEDDIIQMCVRQKFKAGDEGFAGPKNIYPLTTRVLKKRERESRPTFLDSPLAHRWRQQA